MKYFGGCDVGSTYTKCVILDENGKIEKEWRKIKVKGHVDEVIEYLSAI